MADTDANQDNPTYNEGNSELNGKDAAFRHAPMISEPRLVQKRRIRGALVPMGTRYDGLS